VPDPAAPPGAPATLDLLAAPRPLPPGRPAAVLVTLWRDPHGGGEDATRLLFIRRTAGGAHAGQFAFPGGKLEAGDAGPAAAALREAAEEVALEPDGVRVLGYLQPVAIPVSGFSVQPVVAAVAPRVDPGRLRPEAGEVADVFFRSLGELAACADWERRPPQSLRQGAWPVFHLPEGRLWGATAIMVKALLRRWRRPGVPPVR